MTAPVDGPGALLEGRTAVVTGGGAGIGAATSRLLARHGAHVFVVDVDRGRAADTAAAITAAGHGATPLVCDVTDAAQVEDLRRSVLDGGGGLDVLVNNAGDWIRNVGGFAAGGPEHWDDLHRINFLHILLVTRAFLPAMTAAGRGAIVNVSSVEGLRGYPVDPVYAAYKAAAVHFTRSLAVQVGGHGVRVNGIGPDVTESLQVPYSEWIPADQQHMWPQWVPVGRMGHPDEQARAVLFLASDLSSFVTGHTIPTDGGTLAGGGWYRSARAARGWTNRPIDP
ncbi:MAG TPA: SDR family oxidoreductase [Acidimicrobiales bacterium]|nr:SDR family oxidoreductase [Acidimicrobiales bacterium]